MIQSSAKKMVHQKILTEVEGTERFFLANGTILSSVRELAQLLPIISPAVFSKHVNAERNDFALWIRGVFHDDDFAERVSCMNTKEALASLLREQLECAQLAAQLQDMPGPVLGEGVVPYHDEEPSSLGSLIERESKRLLQPAAQVSKMVPVMAVAAPSESLAPIAPQLEDREIMQQVVTNNTVLAESIKQVERAAAPRLPEGKKVVTYFDSENLDVQNIVDELREDYAHAKDYVSVAPEYQAPIPETAKVEARVEENKFAGFFDEPEDPLEKVATKITGLFKWPFSRKEKAAKQSMVHEENGEKPERSSDLDEAVIAQVLAASEARERGDIDPEIIARIISQSGRH